jgi:Gpi18-like mannosyltransferase
MSNPPTRAKELKSHLPAMRPYAEALAIYVASRFIVLMGVFFSTQFVPQKPGDFWNSTPKWYRFFLRYDSGWYLTIAGTGYSYNGDIMTQQSVVFYPLYPLLARGLHYVFGMDLNLAVLLVANLSAVIAIVLLYRLVSLQYDKAVALYTVALISLFPTSFFFSAGYTESLTFLLIVLTFLSINSKRFLLAACCAGLASASRATGVLLLLPLLWELWRNSPQRDWRLATRIVGYSVIATSGLWIFMIWLWKHFGNPLVFAQNQRAWEVTGQHNSLFKVITLQPFYQHLGDIVHTGPMPNSVDPWIFLIFLGLVIFFHKRVPVSFSLFALGVILLPYLTRTGGELGFQSMSRYLLLAFPVFTIMARLLKKSLWASLTITAIFAAVLFMYSAMFSQWYWIG